MVLELTRWNKRKLIPYDDQYSDADEVARAYLAEQGIMPIGYVDAGKGYTYVIPWDQLPKVLAVFGVK